MPANKNKLERNKVRITSRENKKQVETMKEQKRIENCKEHEKAMKKQIMKINVK